jgi:hypothetical protein
MTPVRRPPKIVPPFACGLALAVLAGCGPADVGSDLVWTSRFESGGLDEWSAVPGGDATSYPMPPNLVEASSEHAHTGTFGAKLTIDTTSTGVQQNAWLMRKGGLPAEAYYSAWYYLPRSAAVGTYWVIFKLRMRATDDDPKTESELFDLDLVNLPSGEMSVVLFDHRVGSMVPLDVTDPVVPVGVWFQVEALYHNANDPSGRIVYWLDGKKIFDRSGPTSATPWVEWDACSVALDLTPPEEVVYIDDCAVSRSRVGPAGVIAE